MCVYVCVCMCVCVCVCVYALLLFSLWFCFGCSDYYSPALTKSDCIVQGIGQKLTTTVRVQHWQRKHFRLYPNRLEWADNYVVCMYVQTIHAYESDLQRNI